MVILKIIDEFLCNLDISIEIYIYIYIISKPFNVRIFISTTTAKSYKNTTKK